MKQRKISARSSRTAQRGRAARVVGFECLEPRCLLSGCASLDASAGEYTVRTTHDTATGNCEYRLLSDGNRHHFASLIQTPEKALIFRPHPSRYDRDGWGMSLLMAPYLAGQGSDSGGLESFLLTPMDGGVQLDAAGSLNGPGGVAGSWTVSAQFECNLASQEVTGTAAHSVSLDQPLSESAGDLNLYRLNSNFLENVLLDDGSVGNTGDTAGVFWSYGLAGSGYSASFVPSTESPATFPQDETEQLNIFLSGEVNQAAGDGPAYKRTPEFRISTESLPPSTPLIFGASWDAGRNVFYEDNVGVTPIVLRASQPARQMSFHSAFSSAPATATRWAAARPWQNAAIWEDVDASGDVVPLDALTLINYLNHNPVGPLPVPPSPASQPPPFVDVSGDNSASPLDVLIVINTLNDLAKTPATGEGESGVARAEAGPAWTAPSEYETFHGAGEQVGDPAAAIPLHHPPERPVSSTNVVGRLFHRHDLTRIVDPGRSIYELQAGDLADLQDALLVLGAILGTAEI